MHSLDAGTEPDAAESATDAAQDDASDIDIDATLPDAEVDLDAPEIDADSNELDAGWDAPPAPPEDAAPDSAADAGLDAGDAGASTCAADDRERWHDFHLSSTLVTQIGGCWEPDSGCSVDSCPMLQCLRQNLGIVSCDVCTAEEGACVAAACAERCSASTDNEACRACACSRGCVAAFEACTGAALDVCADCNETTCTNTSGLAPELIVTVLNQLLL